MHLVPREIHDFIYSVFEVCEIRKMLGQSNGISFCVRSNEGNHNLPHIHAEYGSYNVSIAIADGKVLAGNLPPKQIRIAVDWVLQQQKQLNNDWAKFVISANSSLTKSFLDDEADFSWEHKEI